MNKELFDNERDIMSEQLCKQWSAGICDTCSIPKIRREGDGITEPFTQILYCHKMKCEICPDAPDARMVDCEFYEQ